MLMGYYNINSDWISFKQTSLSASTQKTPCLSDKQWNEFTPKERKVWNQLSPKAKLTIIGTADLKWLAVVPNDTGIKFHQPT